MVSTPNNSCVSLNFETISENDAVSLAELPDAGGEDGEEDAAVEAVAEIVDEFWNRSEEEEGEHERTLVAETIEERTPQGTIEERTPQGTTRKRISEVFLEQHQQNNLEQHQQSNLEQHQQSTTFSIPLRLVFVSGKGVPKIKDAKKIRQKTKKRRW